MSKLWTALLWIVGIIAYFVYAYFILSIPFGPQPNPELESKYTYKVYDISDKFVGYTNEKPKDGCVNTTGGIICGNFTMQKKIRKDKKWKINK